MTMHTPRIGRRGSSHHPITSSSLPTSHHYILPKIPISSTIESSLIPEGMVGHFSGGRVGGSPVTLGGSPGVLGDPSGILDSTTSTEGDDEEIIDDDDEEEEEGEEDNSRWDMDLLSNPSSPPPLSPPGPRPREHRVDEEDKELARTVGSPAFLSPELCCPASDEGRDQPVNHMLDVWALGITLYCLCYGQCPWWGRGEWQLFHSITHDPLPIPDTEEDDQLIDLLHRMLNKNVQHRLPLQRIKSHPWTLQDLEDPQAWLRNTDVESCTRVRVNAAEVHGAVETLKDKVKGKLRRLSTSLGWSPLHQSSTSLSSTRSSTPLTQPPKE
ncbi:kinase-like domain-containing protein [Piptocephalis cylindrospora]|uniref:Kinase-like domain-containing protein n=1 Tax=Piptocephalis cylindrospora TaxID=1907219 RepID=A0A4P9Y071_9FUNG|nr:kinase-like domain-containing protein [Piptocephalis cylindrospora]|eukprot:RKP11411.1 kinase-like domain-containing protein [Piptocephalis cylindrospora]